MEWQITCSHHDIVQEQDWLNTIRPLTAQDLAGRIILINFWAACCINCIQVIPEIQSLEKRFGKDLTVIGIHSAKFDNEKDREYIRAAVIRYGIEHPVVNDKNYALMEAFEMHGWPTLMLINPEGMVESIRTGEGHGKQLEHDIDEMIKHYENRNTAPLPVAFEKDNVPDAVLHFPGKLIYVEAYNGQPALFVSDSGHNRIVGMRLDGEIFISIGSGLQGALDGNFEQAQFYGPQGLLYRDGFIYCADTKNHLLRKIDLKSQSVITIAGTGERGLPVFIKDADPLTTAIASPWDLDFFPTSDQITVAMAGTHQLLVYDLKRNVLTTLAGDGRELLNDGLLPHNSLAQPSGFVAAGDVAYFVDSQTSALRKVDSKGLVTSLIGTGLYIYGYVQGMHGTGLLQHPLGLCVDDSMIYIADTYNNSLRRFDSKTGILHNFSGNGLRGNATGSLSQTQYNEPNAIIKGGDKFYVADTNNHRIVVIDPMTEMTSVLPVIEGQRQKTLQSPAHNLPNLKKLPSAIVAAKIPLSIEFKLREGYKINDQAPFWLALFEQNGNGDKLVKECNKADLKNNVVAVPQLESDKKYRLKGTVYYCQDIQGSLCLVQSYDLLVDTTDDSSATKIIITIGADEPPSGAVKN